MKQRFLLAILATIVLSTPLTVEGQQAGKVWRIAYLSAADGHDPNDAAFDDAAKKLGSVEGQNLAMGRWYLGKRSVGVDEVMQEAVRFKARRDRHVGYTVVSRRQACHEYDPRRLRVRAGASGTWPRGELGQTRYECHGTQHATARRQDVRGRTRIDPSAVPGGRSSLCRRSPGSHGGAGDGGAGIGIQARVDSFQQQQGRLDLLATVDRGKAQVLVAPGTVLQLAHRKEIILLTAKTRLPAVYGFREAVDEGGLISFGTDLKELSRRAAHFVARILKGAKPADLPVEQPTKFELVINMRTARALGLTMPPSLALRADHVIE